MALGTFYIDGARHIWVVWCAITGVGDNYYERWFNRTMRAIP